MLFSFQHSALSGDEIQSGTGVKGFRTLLIPPDIDAPEAWDIRTDANDIIVAVIDTGVDYNHPDLAANMWINELEYFGDPHNYL